MINNRRQVGGNRRLSIIPSMSNNIFAFMSGFALCNFFHGFLLFHNPTDHHQQQQPQHYNHNIINSQIETSIMSKLDKSQKDDDNNNNNKPSIEKEEEEQQQQQQQQQALNNDKNHNDNHNQIYNLQPTNFCSSISTTTSTTKQSIIPSTISLWSNHISTIFKSTKHLADKDYEWHDLTAKLLNIFTPQRLAFGTKTIPKHNIQWDRIGDILDIAFKRWEYLEYVKKNNKTNNDKKKNIQYSTIPRKVNILVMGGSVTMGVRCSENPVVETSRFARRDCAWPTRLHTFLNTVFGHNPNDLIRIDALTLGGTNTNTASMIWDYTLMPKDIPYPDIVIHGYATNDMHVLSVLEAQKLNISLEEMIMKVNQNFIQKVLTPKLSSSSTTNRCQHPTPYLIYYDDYIGNEQREILQTNAFSKAIQLLSTYYGFSLVSYADTIKDLVYYNTTEEWLSPSGWPERQVHPGMSMHIASTWVIAFHLLHLAGTYCSIQTTRSTTNHHNNIDNIEGQVKPYTAVNGLPILKEPNKILKGEPLDVSVNYAHPPELNDSLTLDNISQRWEQKRHEQKQQQNMRECHYDTDQEVLMPRPCIFSWVGNLERKFDKTKHLNDRMKPFIITNDGWTATDDSNKLGYSPTKENAMFEMELTKESLKASSSLFLIKTLNFLVMKSYGEKWSNSKIKVDAYFTIKGNTEEQIKSMDITGFHDKNTSETYTAQLDLVSNNSNNDIVNGVQALEVERLKLRITLIGGMTFKIMGMAFCDH